MRHAYFIFFLLLFSNLTFGCEYLYGIWKSSMEDNLKFASKNPDVTSKQLDFVKYAFGHLRLSFSKDFIVTHESGEVDVIIEGKNHPFKFDYSKSSVIYKSCEKAKAELGYEGINGIMEEYKITVVAKDRFWVQLESEIAREYFHKIE